MNTSAERNRSNGADKKQFWQEQDKINRVLIRRSREMHDILVQLNQSLAHSRTDLAEFKGGAKNAFMKLKHHSEININDVKRELTIISQLLTRVQRQLDEKNRALPSLSSAQNRLIYAAVVFSFLALVLSVLCLIRIG